MIRLEQLFKKADGGEAVGAAELKKQKKIQEEGKG